MNEINLFRARAKSGIRLLGATATSDLWNVSFDSENSKHTVARVTIFRNDQETEGTSPPNDNYMDENELVFALNKTSKKKKNQN